MRSALRAGDGSFFRRRASASAGTRGGVTVLLQGVNGQSSAELARAAGTGAGANSRHAVGVATFWGMLTATLVGMLFVPPLYVLFRRLAGVKG